jgi:hypothetical protein
MQRRRGETTTSAPLPTHRASPETVRHRPMGTANLRAARGDHGRGGGGRGSKASRTQRWERWSRRGNRGHGAERRMDGGYFAGVGWCGAETVESWGGRQAGTWYRRGGEDRGSEEAGRT